MISKLTAGMQQLQQTDAAEVEESVISDPEIVLPVAQSSETPILDIPDKTFLTIQNNEIDQRVPKLEEQGIRYHITPNEKMNATILLPKSP